MTDRHGQTLKVHISDTKQIDIHIQEPKTSISENLSLSTWGASFILANQLYKIDVSEALETCRRNASLSPNNETTSTTTAPHAPILELGAGTALVGLTAALLWNRDAILTDLPAIVAGTAATVAANKPSLAASQVQVHCGSLDWFRPQTLSFHQELNTSPNNIPSLAPTSHKFPIILAADVVYDEEHPDLLLQTVTTWLAPGRASRFVLAYVLRVAYLDVIRDLWAKFEAAGLECVEEGQTTGDDSWDEMAPYEWCSWRWRE
jgi:hypothetical protein